MKMMVIGENLRFVKVDEQAEIPYVEWLSEKARKQRRAASGRFLGPSRARKTTDRKSPHGFSRFFVLAKPLD